MKTYTVNEVLLMNTTTYVLWSNKKKIVVVEKASHLLISLRGLHFILVFQNNVNTPQPLYNTIVGVHTINLVS